MFKLKKIGKIVGGKQSEIQIDSDYRKALKRLDHFSHAHLFYIVDKNNDCKLETQIVEIMDVNTKSGKVKIKDWHMNQQEVELVDIKPYFPCEDSVKEKCEADHLAQRSVSVSAHEREKDLFDMQPIGVIRQTHGLVYIELNDEVSVKSDYIKVLWWFDKFDDDKYRRIVECNPPYEDAPRSGVFATRSPVRPNPLAMTVVKVEGIDKELGRLYISGIESFDKTPCLGMIDYQTKLDYREEVRVPEYLSHWPKWLDIRKKGEAVNKGIETEGKQDISILTLINQQNEKILAEEKQESKKEEISKITEEGIWVKGAKENNLKNIEVRVPYKKITAVVGVSGSGKSSLVKETIYAECKRRMEYLSNEHHVLPKPKMEYMSGCIPSVLIQQSAIRGNSQSTVGTYTNGYDFIRMIFATVGIRHCPRCGHEIIPLTKEQIISVLKDQNEMRICTLDKKEIDGRDRVMQIENALEAGKGAFYVQTSKKEWMLVQTKQKCFHCDTLMFKLTPSTFSYLDLENRCPKCNGTGKEVEVDLGKLIEHPELSLLEGASSFWGKLKTFIENPNANWMKGQVIGLAEKMEIDIKLPWEKLPDEFKKKLLWGAEEEVTFTYDNKKNGRKGEITRKLEGAIPIIMRFYQENDETSSITKYLSWITCETCHGERIGKEGRNVTIGKMRYPEVAALSFKALKDWCQSLQDKLDHMAYEKISGPVSRLMELTKAATTLGIEYISLNRETSTLSGGEGQRLKLLAAIQNHMTGLLYVFDEPSKGLHPKDYEKVAKVLEGLKEEGNTVMMVEHNEDMIKVADHVIEIGPGAGEEGGYVIDSGSFNEVITHEETQIGKYLAKKEHSCLFPKTKLNDKKFCHLEHLNYNNLKDVSVSFPKEALTCICGVSGSGKSSLMRGEIFEYYSKQKEFKEVCLVDQNPIGKSSRSVVATYTGIMDFMRGELANTKQAKALGFDEKYFSFNSVEGQCECCKGDGRVKLMFLEDAYMPCPECNGLRYKKSVRSVTYREKHVGELLEMSVKEALRFWKEEKELVEVLKILVEVGLGYLKLGQSTASLSGGEASRLKLAKQLMGSKRQNVLYLFDEPTTGLHFSDIDRILELIHKLIEKGNTVMVIEHNKQFIPNCDWMIEVGPGAGKQGGTIVYQGEVECK